MLLGVIEYNDLAKIVEAFFRELNNCKIKKEDFDLSASIVNYKNEDVTTNDFNASPYRIETVFYKSGVLNTYSSYDNISGVKKFDYSNGKYDIYLKQMDCSVDEYVNNETKKLADLKKMIPVRLDADTKKLIEAYELFYEEPFNLNLPDTANKTRYMMFILHTYYLDFNGEMLFRDVHKTSPMSPQLEPMLDILKDVNIVAFDSSFEELTIEEKEQISKIGSVVSEHVRKYDYPIGELKQLCWRLDMLRTNNE